MAISPPLLARTRRAAHQRSHVESRGGYETDTDAKKMNRGGGRGGEKERRKKKINRWRRQDHLRDQACDYLGQAAVQPGLDEVDTVNWTGMKMDQRAALFGRSGLRQIHS